VVLQQRCHHHHSRLLPGSYLLHHLPQLQLRLGPALLLPLPLLQQLPRPLPKLMSLAAAAPGQVLRHRPHILNPCKLVLQQVQQLQRALQLQWPLPQLATAAAAQCQSPQQHPSQHQDQPALLLLQQQPVQACHLSYLAAIMRLLLLLLTTPRHSCCSA
jgi:hypothetical protein